MVYLGVGYIVLYAAVGWLLRDHSLALSLFSHAGLLLPPITVCAIILRRRARWAGCHRLFWDTVAIGVALWAIGHVGGAVEEIMLGRPGWLRWHTVFSLCGGIGPLIALFARPHRGVRRDDVGPVGLVLASYGLLAVFIYSYFVLVPGLVPGTTDPEMTLRALVLANRALLFGSMTAVMIVARQTAWSRTYVYLAIATGIAFFLRVATSHGTVHGPSQGASLYALVLIAPFLLYAAAALAAPDSPEDSAVLDLHTPVLHVAIAAVPVFLIPLIGYTSLYIQPLGDAGDAFRALLTGLMTVAGLGLLTIRLAAQGGELQRADARMRLLAAATEQTGDLILITSADGEFEHANDAFVRALGYSRAELSQLGFSDLMEHGFGTLGAHVASEVRERGVWRGTLLRRRRDNSTFPAACTVVGLKDSIGSITHFVGVERDITDELKLREQLVHSERLSAIGELVAGVAHELNNPLQTIVGSVDLMMENRPSPSTRRDLEVVRREAARAGQIVRNLLSFVRRSTPDRLPADLNDLIRVTIAMREYHLGQRNITLVSELQPGPLRVMVNREEIQQIVLNLIVNAEQAMAAAGRGSMITVRSRASGPHQIIEVEDDGPGVGPELRGRVFEPFFTTKEVGQGTGLGLSISHGIASAHGGSLELCADTPGACFRLTLPAYSEPASHRLASTPQRNALRRALVVDDETPIRKLLVLLLKRRGFEVTEAETGDAALVVAGDTPFSIVLCDVRMPGMSGPELYRALRAKDPGLEHCFVFITGDESIVDVDEELRSLPVLVKPFTSVDLQAVLTRMGIDAAVA